jgi:hypothetical protein
MAGERHEIDRFEFLRVKVDLAPAAARCRAKRFHAANEEVAVLLVKAPVDLDAGHAEAVAFGRQ